MEWVVRFERAESGSVSLVGGKGSNLMALTAAGFPVPTGFVVTSHAYHEFVAGIDAFGEATGELSYQDPIRLQQQCDRIQTLIRESPIPEFIRDAVISELRRLDRSGEAAYAVRSSSTLEDLAEAAFAGQHDTYLNLRGATAILEGIRNCFSSLWSPRAVLYRKHQGYQSSIPRMAVVVQRQIDCDCAGVGFSIDPVSGDLNRLVLNANFGLGESVVGGECEVDQFELTRPGLEIVERRIGHKQMVVTPVHDGVVSGEVAVDRADAPCLTDPQIVKVARLLVKVHEYYGWPQDIEWGWAGNQLYLFQSRAITTLPPRYTRDESAERFPNPMTPLTWDCFREVFRNSLSHSLDLMGLPPLRDDWFSLHGSYVYGNQNAVDLLRQYRPLNSRSLPELSDELPSLRRRYSWVLDLPIHWARNLDRYLLRLGRLSAQDLSGMDVPELWEQIRQIQQTANDYFLPNIAISMTQGFLHGTLLQLVSLVVGESRAMEVFDGLMSGCQTKTAVVNHELHEIARMVVEDEQLTRELCGQSGRAFWESGKIREFPQFESRLDRFLEDHGHRELDMDHFQPTWSGQPWVVIDSIALIAKTPQESEPEEVLRAQRVRHSETELNLLSQLPADLRYFFRELIRLTRGYTELDDLEHYQTTRVNPVARQAALALGQKLVNAGALTAADDIFFLHRSELEEGVGQFPDGFPDHWRSLAEQRKQAYLDAYRTPPDWTLGEPSLAAENGGEMLNGLPGSPGRVTGACYLVEGPEDFADFPEGAILVARTTNPAWTALFYRAGGLITESGGPLSHGAVTAREMQLPAVMSVRGVMSRLQNGQIVTVDGVQGVIAPVTDSERAAV